MDAPHIARICHEADRAHAASHGDLGGKVWPALEAYQRDNLVRGVKVALSSPGASAEQLHASWMADKQVTGWRFAPLLCLDARTDPLLIPWAQLSERTQSRERMFVAIVRSLAPVR